MLLHYCCINCCPIWAQFVIVYFFQPFLVLNTMSHNCMFICHQPVQLYIYSINADWSFSVTNFVTTFMLQLIDPLTEFDDLNSYLSTYINYMWTAFNLKLLVRIGYDFCATLPLILLFQFVTTLACIQPLLCNLEMYIMSGGLFVFSAIWRSLCCL